MQVSMPFHNTKCVLTWAFECPKCTNFLKSIWGMKMNHSKKIFMTNEYKHEQNGSPISNLKKSDVVKALC
jgi:hypothetical protein